MTRLYSKSPGAFRRDRSGVASIEFALTFVVVLIALLGIFEVGFIFLTKRGIDRGVVDSARWVAVNGTTATAVTVKTVFVTASAMALGAASASNCTVAFAAVTTITSGCAVNVVFAPSQTAGSAVTVTAQFVWVPFTTLVKIGTLTLTSSVALTVQE
jgi:Flp pilus assembly protein TadG